MGRYLLSIPRPWEKSWLRKGTGNAHGALAAAAASEPAACATPAGASDSSRTAEAPVSRQRGLDPRDMVILPVGDVRVRCSGGGAGAERSPAARSLRGGVPRTAEAQVEHGRDEQVEQGRGEQAAQDHHRQRELDLVAGSGSENDQRDQR